MTDGHAQPTRIHELMLQSILPQAWAITIAATAIGQEQHFWCRGIVRAAKVAPPPAQGVDRESGGIGRGPDIDIAGVALRIIKAVRDGNALGQRTKIIDVHTMRVAAPADTAVLEQPD